MTAWRLRLIELSISDAVDAADGCSARFENDTWSRVCAGAIIMGAGSDPSKPHGAQSVTRDDPVTLQAWLAAVRRRKCDYSLHHVATRPATLEDQLVTTEFSNSITHGFAAVGEPQVAVCLLPGTELGAW
jgi:hypothetical protein